MGKNSTVLIAPGFADSNPLLKMFQREFGKKHTHSIPVPGHPNTNPTNPQYWISAFGGEAINILGQTQSNLVVTNSIHTIETLSRIKELEEAGDLKNTRIASFAPAFDVVTAVVNMYNRACKDSSLKTREDILSGDTAIYEKLMGLVEKGQGNPEEFCRDLNRYNRNPELFFELVEYFGERIKILLNPNDRIIFNENDEDSKNRILNLKPIEIRGRGKGKDSDGDALLSHIVGKTVSSEVGELKSWIS